MKQCIHYWIIKDDESYHQIGCCSKCGEEKDFGLNPTIVTDQVMITTNYARNPFTGKVGEFPALEVREYQYPKPSNPDTTLDDDWMTREFEYIVNKVDGLVYLYR